MSRNKARAVAAVVIGVLTATAVAAYARFVAPTRIALVSFYDISVAGISEAAEGLWVSIERVGVDELETRDLQDFDVIFFNSHGLSLSAEQRRTVVEAAAAGVSVHTVGATDPEADITNLTGETLAQVNAYFAFGGTYNMRALLGYVRKHLDHKHLFTGGITAPRETPDEGLFHLGEEAIFKTVADYEAYARSAGRLREGAPKIAIFTGVTGPKNPHTRKQYDLLIEQLEAKGHNVYPVFGFRSKLRFLKEIRPNLVIYSPHGRFANGQDAEFQAAARELNIPILTAVNVFRPYDEWLNDQRGLDGGSLAQAVVLPELDGAIEPFAISALKPNKDGLQVMVPIESRIERLVRRADRWLALRSKANREKKVAIFYYKGDGKNAMVASSMEIAPSLLSLLRALREQGYETGPLPQTADELYQRIQREGPVIGTFAQGDLARYWEEGNPAVVPAKELKAWMSRRLEPKLIADLERDHGPLPGRHMVLTQGEEAAIAVARVAFGNVVLLPLPATGDGTDGYKLVHEVKKSPAYPYVAAYLWVAERFGADVFSHFGTHGSVEFLPGKQVVLSQLDWPDALIPDLPHVYLYSVEDPGEAIVAKRRSLATMVSHLTAPFMRAELAGEMSRLDDKLHDYLYGDVPAGLLPEYRRDLAALIQKSGVANDIGLTATAAANLDAEAISKLNRYLHELELSKVGRGRYVLGRSYAEAELRENVLLMNGDRLADAMMARDLAVGKITQAQFEDRHLYVTKYLKQAERIVTGILDGKTEPAQHLPAADLARLEAWDRQASVKSSRRTVGEALRDEATPKDKIATAGSAAYAADLTALFAPGGDKASLDKLARDKLAGMKEHLKFYADHRYLADELASQGETGAAIAAILRSDAGVERVQRRIAELDLQIARLDELQRADIESLRALRDALENVRTNYALLKDSPRRELAAILNAYSGGFIEPSAGGDPIFNPQALPTGRNLNGINPERVPSPEAWRLAKDLGDQVIQARRNETGAYPKKIAFTFWSSEFLRDKGIQLAQVFYMLGVEPVWNAYGEVNDVKLIPAEKLGRPRIDVVVQTSGQFRDLAASRIYLINKAVKIAAAANDPEGFVNYAKEGATLAEKVMKEKGLAPVEAQALATIRVFGGANGNYGTNIMGLVESGDRWEDENEIADTYINNMGAMYDKDRWSVFNPIAFEAAIQNTEMILQPRTSNVYGPLNLDHVYEFMGGFSSAIRRVTGNDPDAYFNDMRNQQRLRVQSAKEAIWAEARTTILSPAWIREAQQEGPTAAEEIAEVTRDMYGWDAVKSAEIDEALWQEHYEVYVEDKHQLDMRAYFESKNPYALQEITAVMLETVRKGYWKPDEAVVAKLAQTHTELVQAHGAGCSGFVCDNAKLRDFIAGRVAPDLAGDYRARLTAARTSPGDGEVKSGRQMVKEEKTLDAMSAMLRENRVGMLTLLSIVGVIALAVIYGARSQRGNRE